MRMMNLDDGRTMLRYRVDGCSMLHIPPFSGKGRADDLWQTTCFELFLSRDGGGPYLEFNFSPSGRWAVYYFEAYRQNPQCPELLAQPDIECLRGEDIFILTAFLAAPDLAQAGLIGVSAVIEEEGGRKSYWALSHPSDKPDFHDPACFIVAGVAAGNS